MKPTIIAKDNEHLQQLIHEEMRLNSHECSLNHIDVSQITDMSGIFINSPFEGDISQWNTSNVTNMASMFYHSFFNGNISNWDTSNVKNMKSMFERSKFNGDISQWNVSKVIDMSAMFFSAKFDKDISNWIPFKLEDMRGIFHNSRIPIPYWAQCKKHEREKAIKKYQLVKELNQYLVVNSNEEKKLKI